MPKPLIDGERRVMRPAWAPDAKRSNYVKVTAHRVDSETPYVILEIDGVATWLEDVTAIDLVNRIQRALSVLPTSK